MHDSIPDKDDPAADPTTLLVLRSFGHTFLGLLVLVSFIWVLGEDDKLAAIRKLVYTEFVHIFGGPAGHAVVGSNLKMSPWFIFIQSLLTDLVIVLYGYALFVSGFRHAAKWRYIGPKLVSAHQLALDYKDRIKPYGIVGLFGFVIFPLWSTGPLVGSIIGYMIGLGTITTFTTMTLAMATATGIYVFGYDWVYNRHSTAAMLITIVVILLACGAIFTQRRIKTTIQEKRGTQDSDSRGGPVIDITAQESDQHEKK